MNYDFYRKNYSERKIREYIKTYPELLNEDFWWNIGSHQRLSEPFIREFSDKLDIEWLSLRQKLSEKFIRDFSDKVHWGWILGNQKLSEKFLIEFIEKINLDNYYDNLYLFKDNKKIPEDVKKRIINLKKVIDQ